LKSESEAVPLICKVDSLRKTAAEKIAVGCKVVWQRKKSKICIVVMADPKLSQIIDGMEMGEWKVVSNQKLHVDPVLCGHLYVRSTRYRQAMDAFLREASTYLSPPKPPSRHVVSVNTFKLSSGIPISGSP
jgi:hypothetical protein